MVTRLVLEQDSFSYKLSNAGIKFSIVPRNQEFFKNSHTFAHPNVSNTIQSVSELYLDTIRKHLNLSITKENGHHI